MENPKDVSEATNGKSNQFDYYSKKVIRHLAMNELEKHKRECNKQLEVPLDESIAVQGCNDEYQVEKIPLKIGEETVMLDSQSLVDALMAIGEKKRQVIIMSVVFGIPVNEIAEFLNIKNRTVIEYKSIGLQRLKQMIEELDE